MVNISDLPKFTSFVHIHKNTCPEAYVLIFIYSKVKREAFDFMKTLYILLYSAKILSLDQIPAYASINLCVGSSERFFVRLGDAFAELCSKIVFIHSKQSSLLCHM